VLATGGGWSHGAFPAVGLAAAPNEARAKLWDDLWAALNFAPGTLPVSFRMGGVLVV
jgi:hypothetical protein